MVDISNVCARAGCEAEALVSPVVLVWAKGDKSCDKERALKLHIPFGVCLDHKPVVRARELLGGPMGWARIVAAMEQLGRRTPDKKSASIEWVSTDEMREVFAAREKVKELRTMDLSRVGR